MTLQAAREREIREIVIAANSGEASHEQMARLDELIRSDRHLAKYAAHLLDQQASLAWLGSMQADGWDRSRDLRRVPVLIASYAFRIPSESADAPGSESRQDASRREHRPHAGGQSGTRCRVQDPFLHLPPWS